MTRVVACVDCRHCTKTPRGLRRSSYTCALHGDCYAARFGGACGEEGKDFADFPRNLATPPGSKDPERPLAAHLTNPTGQPA